MRKRMTLLFVCILLTWNTTFVYGSTIGFENESQKNVSDSEKVVNDIDELDAMIMASYVLNSEEKCYWPNDISDRIFIPLYDNQDEIVAYYISFYEGGYAVINNNRSNPEVIEFGDSDNYDILEIVNSKNDYHIIYNSPFDLYDKNDVDSKKSYESAGYGDYKDLNRDLYTENHELSNMLASERKRIENSGQLRDVDADYGFFTITDSNEVTAEKILKFARTNDWMYYQLYTMAGGTDVCCGTIAATNLSHIFAQMGYSRVNKGTPLNTFWQIENSYIPTGMRMTIASDIVHYFSDNGYTLNHSSVVGYQGIKNATANNRPCGILLKGHTGVKKWHWVVSIGYREYGNTHYVRIIDGWNNSLDRYYRYDSVYTMSANSYYVSSYNNDLGAFVLRLYSGCFNRNPISEGDNGFYDWVRVLFNHTAGGKKVARNFFFSNEYISLNKSDHDYVEDLYYVILNRAPDQNGFDSWLAALQEGHSRLSVFNGFAKSVEFSNLCAQYLIIP